MDNLENRRVLFVDDMAAIHEDFRKILSKDSAESDLEAAEAALLGATSDAASVEFDMDSAFQGQEALDKVRAALSANRPYAMAFIDMRMPPGWDGVETVEHLWAKIRACRWSSAPPIPTIPGKRCLTGSMCAIGC